MLLRINFSCEILIGDSAETFGYVAADNLLSIKAGKQQTTFMPNAVSQVLTRNGVAWIHDANGNVLDDGRNLSRQAPFYDI